MTRAEAILWGYVRDRRFEGLKFRRQSAVAGSVCDFVCAELRLIVELDGGVHRLREAEDAIRDEKLRNAGFTVVRSGNEAFLSNPNRLFDAIHSHAATVRTATAAGPQPIARALGNVEPPPHPSGSAAHLLPRGEKDVISRP